MKLVELCGFLLFLAALPWIALIVAWHYLTPLEIFLLLVVLIGALTR